MTSPDTVRRAGARDRDRVVSTIVSAFRGDPAWHFMLGSDYDRLAPLFAGALVDCRLPGGTVWMTPEARSVALWEPPGGSRLPESVRDLAWSTFRQAAHQDVLDRVAAYDRAVHAADPEEQFWYLGVLATAPQWSGSGLATSVLAPALQLADTEALACCLETSTERNLGFYRRRGFTQQVAVLVPDGPETWWLTRPPRPPA